MTIPDTTLNKWKALRSYGDAAKMAARMENGYAEAFNRAFREGKCRDDVFRVMSAFYKEKEEFVKEHL